jgi:hypothetical protein
MRGKDFYIRTKSWIQGPIAAYVVLALLYIIVLPKKYTWFSWHPFAAILGFIGLASNATLIKKIGGIENTRAHGMMMSAATALALFGGYVIYSNKEMFGRPHFMTPHGKFGAILILAYVGLGLAGAIFLHPDFGIMNKNQTIRQFHKYAGLLVTAGSWLCCCSGFATLHQTPIERALFSIPLVVLGYYVLL